MGEFVLATIGLALGAFGLSAMAMAVRLMRGYRVRRSVPGIAVDRRRNAWVELRRR